MVAGGNERLCLELMRQAPVGVEQALVTIYPRPGGPLESLFRSIPDLQFLHVPYTRTERARFVVEMARCLRDANASGVICYPFGLHLLIALAAKSLPRCRFIVHVGNPPPVAGSNRTMFRAIVIASRWLTTPLWSCSQTVHDQLSELASPLPPGSRAMPNGINIRSLEEA